MGGRSVAALALSAALGGCASLGGETRIPFRFVTEPFGVDVRTSTGFACSTPCTIEMPGDREFRVVLSKEGFETRTVEVGFVTPDGRRIPLRDDGFFGRFASTPTDPVTGAPLRLGPERVTATLRPLTPAERQAARPASGARR